MFVVGALGGLKCAQISTIKAAGARAQKAGPPPEAVSTRPLAEEQAWEGTLDTGAASPRRRRRGQQRSAGHRVAIHFESGESSSRGRCSSSSTPASSARSSPRRAQKELADDQRSAHARPRRDGSGRPGAARHRRVGAQDLERRLRALKAQIDRKIVRAPFAGRLGIRPVNLGPVPEPGHAGHRARVDRLGVRRLHAAAAAPRARHGRHAGARHASTG